VLICSASFFLHSRIKTSFANRGYPLFIPPYELWACLARNRSHDLNGAVLMGILKIFLQPKITWVSQREENCWRIKALPFFPHTSYPWIRSKQYQKVRFNQHKFQVDNRSHWATSPHERRSNDDPVAKSWWSALVRGKSEACYTELWLHEQEHQKEWTDREGKILLLIYSLWSYWIAWWICKWICENKQGILIFMCV
jgi:hypothetical protein